MYIPTEIFAGTALAVPALITGALILKGTVLVWVLCIIISCSGAVCIKEKGIAWMNNDIANLLSNVFALVLAPAV